jgi:hypothetical protein
VDVGHPVGNEFREGFVQHDSLFGHFASRSGQPENVATGALNYILNRSSVAKSAFLRFVAQTNVELPDALLFRTQATGSDNAIPDLVGTDSESRQVFLVEAKFWAGLTSNQPITYLKRLPSEADGLLLFIAPAKRFDTLWTELLRRCRNENFAVEQSQGDITEEFRAIKIGPTHTLALTSWRAVLSYMLRALETEGEHHAASDVQQLQGLCERMDSGVFLPLRSEELTADTGARIVQYCQLVDEAIHAAKAAGIVSTEGFSYKRGAALYGHYLGLAGNQCLLHFSGERWGRLRSTPLWLRVDHVQSKPWMKDALAILERDQPPRLLPAGRDLLVPINLPTGVEKQDVVSAVVEQVREVADLLHDYDRIK